MCQDIRPLSLSRYSAGSFITAASFLDQLESSLAKFEILEPYVSPRKLGNKIALTLLETYPSKES